MTSRHCIVSLLIATLGVATVSSADELDRCVAAAEKAQQQRDEGKYVEARESLLVCSRDACPSVVVKDCVEMLAQVDKSIPTLVFEVVGLEHHQAGAVRVFIDGDSTGYGVDGKPVLVDAGWHTFVFKSPTGETRQQTFLAKYLPKHILFLLYQHTHIYWSSLYHYHNLIENEM